MYKNVPFHLHNLFLGNICTYIFYYICNIMITIGCLMDPFVINMMEGLTISYV